ncbi:NADH dehydrogenase (Ubiquinone) 24 kDa subunit [metagenome]|uniref:NADH dehydrogenase (Ubiquinone) 24 kDa subunit n=1 Tax=metagenome TaxID=256318 RepID=A0A2P2CB85_9ZZZZ
MHDQCRKISHVEDDITSPVTSLAESAVGSAVEAAVAAHREDRGPLLPVLHAVQRELGWLPPETAGLVGKALNLSRAEVYGVITFYADFRSQPPARRTVRVCGAEACQARGARALSQHARERLGARPDLAVEQVLCLGNCALGPTIELDGVLHGRVDPARFDALVEGGRG